MGPLSTLFSNPLPTPPFDLDLSKIIFIVISVSLKIARDMQFAIRIVSHKTRNPLTKKKVAQKH